MPLKRVEPRWLRPRGLTGCRGVCVSVCSIQDRIIARVSQLDCHCPWQEINKVVWSADTHTQRPSPSHLFILTHCKLGEKSSIAIYLKVPQQMLQGWAHPLSSKNHFRWICLNVPAASSLLSSSVDFKKCISFPSSCTQNTPVLPRIA